MDKQNVVEMHTGRTILPKEIRESIRKNLSEFTEDSEKATSRVEDAICVGIVGIFGAIGREIGKKLGSTIAKN